MKTNKDMTKFLEKAKKDVQAISDYLSIKSQNNKNALLVKADGSSIIIEPKNKKELTLEEMQEAVDGYIEIVSNYNDYLIIVDEEGLLKGKEINMPISQKLLHMIVGNVLIMPRRMLK